ncbi:hypothetical protein CBR_g12530 [Chara braunii]|uniref:Uncharacterized protein n=1 Tax=Chara braunii TaxID=69332 RepID=A0A388JSU9_CHABU|nr:hypothetical protein CBR_g12530 [Chara braunii]|eukprot:GBG60792.1 hypothetical protein CBR_g12530 [Chara braunii]
MLIIVIISGVLGLVLFLEKVLLTTDHHDLERAQFYDKMGWRKPTRFQNLAESGMEDHRFNEVDFWGRHRLQELQGLSTEPSPTSIIAFAPSGSSPLTGNEQPVRVFQSADDHDVVPKEPQTTSSAPAAALLVGADNSPPPDRQSTASDSQQAAQLSQSAASIPSPFSWSLTDEPQQARGSESDSVNRDNVPDQMTSREASPGADDSQPAPQADRAGSHETEQLTESPAQISSPQISSPPPSPLTGKQRQVRGFGSGDPDDVPNQRTSESGDRDDVPTQRTSSEAAPGAEDLPPTPRAMTRSDSQDRGQPSQSVPV